ncbi:hypothetical protein ABK040_015818 [Willaertia magna]
MQNSNINETSDNNTSHEENVIYQRLIASGEKERLKELLRERLEQEGWKEQMKNKIKDVMQETSLSELSTNSLVQHLTPQARTLIPEHVRLEIVQQIHQFLQKEQDFVELYSEPTTTTKKK